MKSSTPRSATLAGLRQCQVPLFEQLQGERSMHACIQKTVIEGNGQDRRAPVFRDDRQMPVLGVPEQFTGSLSQVANAEGSG